MTDPPDRLTETPQMRALSEMVDQVIDGLIATARRSGNRGRGSLAPAHE